MWSLHMTLLPWFTAPDAESVLVELKRRLTRYEPVEVEVGDRVYFGQRKLPAKLINNTPKLQSLHDTLLRMITDNSWQLEGRYTGANFRPHVTRKKGQDAEGKFTIDAVYIVEKQAQGYREIVGRIEL
jgi:2'-5' RNA ligase